ncbi:MAG TPA: hypothetical protein PLY93_04280, partial [Turneriella sp.]|nr:hypothetical protein [Turneriella sp.]
MKKIKKEKDESPRKKSNAGRDREIAPEFRVRNFVECGGYKSNGEYNERKESQREKSARVGEEVIEQVAKKKKKSKSPQ